MSDNVTRIRENSADVRSRVTVLETQLLNVSNNVEKLEAKAEAHYANLHARISDMRDDLHREIEAKHKDVVSKLNDHMIMEAAHHEKIYDKLSSLEKWRWMIMGGAIVIGYVLAHIEIGKLF